MSLQRRVRALSERFSSSNRGGSALAIDRWFHELDRQQRILSGESPIEPLPYTFEEVLERAERDKQTIAHGSVFRHRWPDDPSALEAAFEDEAAARRRLREEAAGRPPNEVWGWIEEEEEDV